MYQQIEVFDLVTCAWVGCKLEDIKQGDRFRMFKPNGEQVKDNHGLNEWTARHNAGYSHSSWFVTIEKT